MKYHIQKTKIFTFVLLSSLFSEQAFAVPAFPGAEGAAAETVGGRSGRVIEVTNLNSSGPGSLREAIDATGPRTVVFKVAGIIDLAGDKLRIKNPYITIAGQTAPRGGITIKGHELSVETHDVIVRFLQLRTGTEIDLGDQKGDALGMNGAGVYNAIINHCSMSWAQDENAQIWSWATDTAPHDITYSWNIISEGIDGHSTGLITGSYDNTKDFKDISLHHNLFANNSHRLPLIKIASAKMINNLVYNWRHYATGIKGGAHMDIIANKYKAGPETESKYAQEVTVEDSGYGDPTYPRSGAPGYASIYMTGNVGPNNSDPDSDNWKMAYHRIVDTNERPALDRDTFERTTPLSEHRYPITIDSIATAETTVLQDSGASRRIDENGEWVTDRGTVDTRIINEYKNGTGFIPASENEVGGYPNIQAGTPYADSDHDGMADVWEENNGLDKHNYNDNEQDKDSDGYTNLEEFINGTNPGSADNSTDIEPPVEEEPDNTTGQGIIEKRVSSPSDDAEENGSGDTYLNSSDLEIVYDRSVQTAGLRFTGLAIPQDAKITKAYIQFQVDETSTESTELTIEGEDTDNAAVFSAASYNISNRNKTGASVSWSPAAWNSVGEAGEDQRTSDLTSIVQEIVSGSGWSEGNAMAFIITGTGERVAEAYDGDQAGAPLLYVEYTTAEEVTPPVDEDTPSVVDTTPPVITILGANPMNLNAGDTFTDPGATAEDNVDGDLTNFITNNSNVDADTAGSYHVTYTVTDAEGNTATASRNVIVNSESTENNTLQVRVSSKSDDAEETSNGDTYLYSSDLEIVYDHSVQTAGLRFTGLAIPQNAKITKAYIQFQADETSTESTELTIEGEDTDNAAVFSAASYNISNRNKTGASVSWSPAAWNSVGEAGEDQRTSDLNSIVQEIVSGSGWSEGNAMAFIITGTGARVAEAYDGDQAGAPLLYVEYTTADEVTPPVDEDTPSVVDTTPPVITILGANPMNLNAGDAFTDPGATAQDNVDGDITVYIDTSSNVDTDTAGSYHVTYTVTDAEGNTATASRNVIVNSGSTENNTLQVRVSSKSDDAEEKSNGDTYLNSSDLEIVYDRSVQTAGLRFTGLAIPQDAKITKAYIQFQADETSTESTELTIEGEDTDNAAVFSATSYNISNRNRTGASILWSPAAWNSVGEAGEDQRTSDLTSIVQEIVSGSGWSEGNAMAFIITGTGERVAEAYDGDQAGAPLLYVEYTTADEVTPPVDEDTPSVVDTTPPVITILGANPMNLNAGDAFTDPGATAQDNVDGDITVYIDTSSDVNTATAGTYQVSYVVLDVAGNVAEVIRTVNVTGSIDLIDPVDPVDPVDPDPIDSGTTLNVPSDYSSISEALSSAADGDTILLAPGTYNVTETIFINKNNITIASKYLTSKNESDIDATVINGVSDKNLIDGVLGKSVNLKLIGLTITNAMKGITFYNSGGEVDHCKLFNFRSDAISFESDANGAVTYTRVENAGDDAIDVDARKDGNFLFAYNELINSGDDSIEVRLYNRTGTGLMHYDVHDNLFSGAGEDGFQLIDYSENSNRTFDIYNNIFENISDVGIGSMYADTTENFNGAAIPERVRIYNNYFYNNDYHITGGDNMIILNNIFEQSTHEAVKRAKGNSIIDYNLFYNNGTDTSDSVTGNHNLFANPKRNSDYTLQVDSPAIDAGTADYVHNSEAVLSILADEYSGSDPDMGRY